MNMAPRYSPDWVPIGPRFSNGVLQALMVLLNKRPPKVGFPHSRAAADGCADR